MNRYLLLLGFILSLLVLQPSVYALNDDDYNVDKVYRPYVLPLEREVEIRFSRRGSEGKEIHSQRVSFGHSLSERLTLEAYLLANEVREGDFDLAAYELELRWMITDQGQYWADFGALFEIDKAHKVDNWETRSGLLVEKELGRSSVTGNIFITLAHEEGEKSRWLSEFRGKYRYRLKSELQPAIEVYAAKDFLGAGPALMGLHRYEGQKQLKWELAFIREINKVQGDNTARFSLEYEF